MVLTNRPWRFLKNFDNKKIIVELPDGSTAIARVSEFAVTTGTLFNAMAEAIINFQKEHLYETKRSL